MAVKKWRTGIFVLVVLSAMTLLACGADTKDAAQQQTNVQVEGNESSGDAKLSGEVAEKTEPEGTAEELLQIAEVSEEKKQVEIFYGNENADGIISEVVDMEPVTATKILAELSKKNIISADTRVLGLTKENVEGKVRLRLNMSGEFQEYVSMMGTSGEYIVVGCLVNTFLKAYDAEDVLIFIEGKTFETGHELYDNYLQFYPCEN